MRTDRGTDGPAQLLVGFAIDRGDRCGFSPRLHAATDEARSRHGRCSRVRGVEANSPLVTVDEVARVLGVRRWAVYEWASRGRIPCVRAGRKVRFVLAEVVAALHHAPEATGPANASGTSAPRQPVRPRVRRPRAPSAKNERPRTEQAARSATARPVEAHRVDPGRLAAAAATARALGRTERTDEDRER